MSPCLFSLFIDGALREAEARVLRRGANLCGRKEERDLDHLVFNILYNILPEVFSVATDLLMVSRVYKERRRDQVCWKYKNEYRVSRKKVGVREGKLKSE